jgi:hypothetical protein
MIGDLGRLRRALGKGHADAFDIVIAREPGTDPTPYIAAGATWWLVGFSEEEATLDHVLGVIRDGPLGKQ